MKSIETIKESIDSDDDTATDLQGNVLKGIDNCADTAHKARLLWKQDLEDLFYFNFYNFSTFTINVAWPWYLYGFHSENIFWKKL